MYQFFEALSNYDVVKKVKFYLGMQDKFLFLITGIAFFDMGSVNFAITFPILKQNRK